MSSTNRGAVRQEADFYATPEAAFHPLIPYLTHVPKPIWEPASGDDRLVKWMNEKAIFAQGNDLRNGYDFLKDATRRETILTNPPFSLAQEFVDHAFSHSDHVFMLLRLNFLGAGCRRDWWRLHEPSALFVLSDRPGFVMACKCKQTYCKHAWTVPLETERPKLCPKCGSIGNAATKHGIGISTTDSCEYAWFAWSDKFKGIYHL